LSDVWLCSYLILLPLRMTESCLMSDYEVSDNVTYSNSRVVLCLTMQLSDTITSTNNRELSDVWLFSCLILLPIRITESCLMSDYAVIWYYYLCEYQSVVWCLTMHLSDAITYTSNRELSDVWQCSYLIRLPIRITASCLMSDYTVDWYYYLYE
jgi:hypothetical protein